MRAPPVMIGQKDLEQLRYRMLENPRKSIRLFCGSDRKAKSDNDEQLRSMRLRINDCDSSHTETNS
jgi:hypothetical protein